MSHSPSAPEQPSTAQQDIVITPQLTVPRILAGRYDHIAALAAATEPLLLSHFVGAAVLTDEDGERSDEDLAVLATQLSDADEVIRSGEDVPIVSVIRTHLSAALTTPNSSLQFENLNSAVFYGSVAVIPSSLTVRGDIRNFRGGIPLTDTVNKKPDGEPLRVITPDRVLTHRNIEQAKAIGRKMLSGEHIMAVGARPIVGLFEAIEGNNRGSKGAAHRRFVATYMTALLECYGFDLFKPFNYSI
jgi:hypothetical protein